MKSHLDQEALHQARLLLCDLQSRIREEVLRQRAAGSADFSAIAGQTASDTVYQVDRVSEAVVLEWFSERWPSEWPVHLVMEGLEDHGVVTFPAGLAPGETICTCIVDPIDGTRGLMYDKRPAWILAGLAPRGEADPRLKDIAVAAMTEVPTSKQTLADQVSAVRGGGVAAVRADLVRGGTVPLELRPSRAQDFRHGFASLARFFPEGKALLATIEEELWDDLLGLGSSRSPLVFDDQYISTGGQIYEILSGRDRMVADLRPLAHEALGFRSSLVCHPYDFCTAMFLEEAGAIVEDPRGGPVDAPLDTTSAVTWIAYANETLADQARPVLRRLMERHFHIGK